MNVWTDPELDNIKKESYNEALDDAISFFREHIKSNETHIVRNYVCETLEKLKR